jgi:hypothetical protein
VERNNCGAQVVDALIHTHHYESIIKYTPSMGTFTEKIEKDNRLGVYSHTNSKFNAMSNFRYWMNVLRCVKLYDKHTLQEFKTYIRHPNGVWKKQSDKYLDDRVDALIWAIFALDSKVVEQFYEVVEKDGNGKPLKVMPFGFDPAGDISLPKLEQIYNKLNNKKNKNEVSNRTPAFIGSRNGNGTGNSEIDELMADGWKPLRGSAGTGYGNEMMF